MMRARRTRTVALVMMALGGVVGCRVNRDFPPQPLRIVGTSYNPGIDIQIVPPQTPGAEWTLPKSPALGAVSAWGEADLPAAALDPLQGRLAARQMAKQDARRKLAEKVAAIEVRPGMTIGQIVGDDPDKRRRLEEIVRKAEAKGVIKASGGKCSVYLTLDLQPLSGLFDFGEEAAAGGGRVTVTQASSEEFRRHAREEAIENARARALEHVKQLLGERMMRDDTLDRAVRQKIATLEPDTVGFKDDGTCEAVVILDLADIQRILADRPVRGQSATRSFTPPRGLPWQGAR